MADKSYKLTLSLSDGSTINAGTITAPQGPNGANGVTFTPSVSAAGVLSWTNNGGLTNPSPISIKGPKGDDAVITASDVENWGFTKNTGTITEIKMNGDSKGTSGVVDLGTVLTAHSGLVGGNLVQYDSTAQTLKDSGKKISDLATTSQVNAKYTKPSGGIPKTDLATAVQNSLTAADNAMPKSGGTFTGNVSLPKELIFTDNTNPFIKMTTGGTDFYFQSTSGQFGLGPTWNKATHWDSNGNVTFPTTPKVGSISLALKSDIPPKVTDSTVSGWGFTKNEGTVTSVSVKMNGASKGTVTNSGTIDLGTVITAHQDISGKLDKTTYEVNKTIAFGSSGVLYVGKFRVCDTNVTCEVTSTTDVTYSGKLVIATQNYVIKQMTVYGDAANTVAPNFFIKPSTTSDPYIEVYFKPASWSKNVVHIYGSEIKAEPTNVCTNVPSVPSTATLKPKNALPTYSLSGTTLTITL